MAKPPAQPRQAMIFDAKAHITTQRACSVFENHGNTATPVKPKANDAKQKQMAQHGIAPKKTKTDAPQDATNRPPNGAERQRRANI